MNMLKIILAGALLAMEVLCEHLVEFMSNYQSNAQIDYTFRYYIDHPQSGVSLDHWENRRGDYVHGGYGVLDPGGYVRTVHYEVEGNSGFRTVIKTTAPAPCSTTFTVAKSRNRHNRCGSRNQLRSCKTVINHSAIILSQSKPNKKGLLLAHCHKLPMHRQLPSAPKILESILISVAAAPGDDETNRKPTPARR